MLGNPDDVLIDRLNLRTAPTQAATAAGGLYTARWPECPAGEYLFIRNIDVRCPVDDLTAAVERTSAALAADAQDGTHPAAIDAPAVRFRSLGSLLAQLSLDLHWGRAGRLWYWDQWKALFALPPAAAVARLWCENLPELGQVSAELASRQALRSLWLSLTTPETSSIRRTMSAYAGDDRPSPSPAGDPPAILLQRWSPVLTGLGEDDHRVELAARIIMLQWRADRLNAQGPEPWIGRLCRRLTSPGSPAASDQRRYPSGSSALSSANHRSPDPGIEPATPSGVGPAPGTHPSAATDRRPVPAPPHDRPTAVPERTASGDERSQSADRGGTAADTDPIRPPRAGTSSAPDALPNRHRDSRTAIPVKPHTELPSTNIDSGQPAKPGTEHQPATPPQRLQQAERESSPIEDHATRAPDAGSCLTHQGGLFLLLNFLDRAPTRSLVARAGGFDPLCGPWGWLYRLGGQLGLSAEPPLTRLFLHQLGWDDPARLSSLPALPRADEFRRLGERLYGGALWQPALLQRPARVRWMASHIDVDYPLAAATVALRRSGLDLDPGWLPWLGRVVAFHYRDGIDALFSRAGRPVDPAERTP